MRQVLKSLGLLLLLLVAQQAAVIHEIGHLSETSASLARSTHARLVPGVVDEDNCALCPAFAQVVTPAFSHSFHLPVLVRVALERCAEPLHASVDASIPTPRSRGPPVPEV